MHQNEELEVKAPDILTTTVIPGGLQEASCRQDCKFLNWNTV